MLSLLRKNNIFKHSTLRKNSGFALLFAVLMSSLMLSIGLSIFGIALRELSISTAARQSIFAFYAADSGRECALYWDIKKGAFPTLVQGTTGGGAIKCGGKSISIGAQSICGSGGCDGNSTTEVNLIKVPVNITEDSGPYADVNVRKSWLGGVSGGTIKTVVTADGYDSDGGNKILRSIFQTINQ